MSKTGTALTQLLNQLLPQPDDLSIVTNGSMFRHAAATPLTSLLMDLEQAQTHQHNQYISSALHNAQRLKRLFELSAESIAQTKQHSFRVSSAIKETIILLSSHYRQSLVRSHLLIKPTTQLNGSRFLFQEALLCSVKNAIEAYQTNQYKLVLVTAKETDDQLIISIIDGGKGFTAWQKTIAFADGYSTKSRHSGNGLTWIKRVIQSHFEGKVVLTSKQGRGTTMTWLLPKPILYSNR